MNGSYDPSPNSTTGGNDEGLMRWVLDKVRRPASKLDTLLHEPKLFDAKDIFLEKGTRRRMKRHEAELKA
jgi:hypothetical protein